MLRGCSLFLEYEGWEGVVGAVIGAPHQGGEFGSAGGARRLFDISTLWTAKTPPDAVFAVFD